MIRISVIRVKSHFFEDLRLFESHFRDRSNDLLRISQFFCIFGTNLTVFSIEMT